MPVVRNEDIETLELPGIRHQTVAGHLQGVKTMEVWVQVLAPGAETPVHRHDCEEVIHVLSGRGTCTVEGRTVEFGPDTTLIVERDAVHQLVNTSGEDMKLVAALGMAPVRVRTAEGDALHVPWEAPLEGAG